MNTNNVSQLKENYNKIQSKKKIGNSLGNVLKRNRRNKPI